jgi:hypothetical protein
VPGAASAAVLEVVVGVEDHEDLGARS